jgi:hypothetical protein
VADVAYRLGLKGDGRKFDCFRETHPSDKPRRGLSVNGKTNTLKCFGCNGKPLSTIDLVMEMHGCDVGAAIRWLAGCYPSVPMAKVKASGAIKQSNYKSEMTLQDLVLSPGWAAMGLSERAIITALAARCPKAGSEQWTIRCTYQKIAEWASVSRRTAITGMEGLRKRRAVHTSLVRTNRKSDRGFWLRELLVRISALALRDTEPNQQATPECKPCTTATSYSVQDLHPQYAVQDLHPLEPDGDRDLSTNNNEYYEHDCGEMVRQGKVCKACQEMESGRATGDEMPAFAVNGAHGTQDRGETHTWQL